MRFFRSVLTVAGIVGFGALVGLPACSSSSGTDDSSNSTGAGAGGSGAGGSGAGGSGGATTLYAKYGGDATVKKVVDDAVAGLLGDPDEAPFFAVIGMPGHDSVDRLKGCLVLQFTALLGGPATYPGKEANTGAMCDDMTTAHKDLAITGPVFDKFIMDLGAVLKADGVEDADITMIAGALTGLKGQIVTSNGAGGSGAGGAGGGG